ncbi:MAG TPA: hypothetical protein VMS73_02040 [Anaerolineaceae bacterium]|nr:hypothetical protein [Anaerolineaceae bacterium]
MRTRSRSTFWLLANTLILITFIFAPLASLPAGSALAMQGSGPFIVNAPGDDLVTNISLGPDTPNILRNNEDVTVNFSYSTTQAGGVRIFPRPYTNGSPSPNYAASGSPLYPQSATGTGSGTFTITTGKVVVDQIRFQIYDANQTTLLFDTFIPVYYLFGDPINLVTDITLSPDTPNVLQFNQDVNLTFNYSTRTEGGVRIFARPFTNGALTPNYAASGSPLYAIGGGSGSGFFTITSGQVVVDQIRIQMWNANQTTLLFEAFLPVYFRFKDALNIVTRVTFRPDTPNVFKYGQNVNLTFNYSTNQPNGVLIFARPFSGANLSPNYAASGSPIYPPGSGSGTGSFSLTAGPLNVDKVRIQMWDTSQKTLLFEAFLPVHLLWAGSGPPPGPDMSVKAIEVTQAVQDLNNSVDLVAGKQTYVRVHVSSTATISNVFATLSGRRGFVNLTPVLNPGNPGSQITVRTSPDRGQINDSFWFELPSSWTTAGSLTLTANLDPNNAKNDPNLANNTSSVTVNFQDTPPLRLKIVDVQYTSGGTTYLASNFHMDMLESWLRRAYPISNLQVTRSTFIYPTAGLPDVDTLHGYLAFIKLLNILFSSEDGRIVYYGMVDDGGGFMRGKAASIPGTIAAGPTGTGTWGWDFDGSYGDWYGGHEIGHTRGRYHADFCGASGGVPYPYPNGQISPTLTGNTAIYGFDITTHAIYPPSWKDVMTYCSNLWMSDFTYVGIRNYLVGTGFLTVQPAAVTASQFLAVEGMADLSNNTAHLDNVSLITQTNTIPLPVAGDWTLALVGSANNDLATYPFSPKELTDSEPSSGRPAVIAEVVPWTEGTVRVEIRLGNQVVASRSTSAHAPTVTLTEPTPGAQLKAGPFQVSWTGSDQDGDPLTYSLLYSNNGGATWQSLATGLTGSGIQLNTNQLPGGSGMLRVVASDGFLSGQDTSGAFGVPLQAPSVQILSPNQNQVFYPTQQVTLQGSAYDMQDGVLGDAAFVWSSSIDGVLGTGATLNTSELSTGTHIITLTVTDSNHLSSQAHRTIVVTPENTPLAINMDISPFGVGLVAAFRDAPFQTPVSIRSTGAGELNWTASKNVPWLTLPATSGQTPTDLSVTVDPSGLPVGTFYGKISFSSAQAGNSPLDVNVTLQVTGEATFLPLIKSTQ